METMPSSHQADRASHFAQQRAFLSSAKFLTLLRVLDRRLENHVERPNAQRAAACGGIDHVLNELQRQPAVRRPRDDILAHEIEAAEAVNKSVRGKSPECRRLAEKQGLRAITGRGDGGGHAGRANTIYDDIVIRFDRGGVVGFQMAKEVVLVMGGEIDQR